VIVFLSLLLILTSFLLVVLVLLHRGKGGGLSSMFGGSFYSSMSGSSVVERNLDRLTIVAGLATLALALLCITQPFSYFAQFVFVLLLWGIALLVRRVPGRYATLILVVLSITVSCRYLWWRYTATLNWNNNFDLACGIVLLAAETYSWLVLMLGYVQVAWPLQRKPSALPADPRQWPTVDVLIPTYNEELSLVRHTVHAALGLDWPADKLRIHLLDDGRRPEFREFAAQAGVNYITRSDNRHAKAGNLNHALAQLDGELVAIFDCDHLPVRSFLQVTCGWFLRDAKLALVQTPHHFFSPDPFERNLRVFRRDPNEGELFYGLVQDGNDLWNAAFFCGSCAVLRRAAIDDIGGFATETVTEDAHTALRLHRNGWNSAYLRIPQAAGLATDSLGAHVNQRIRWARGMAQICRVDNPLFGPGLSIGQRLCYLNAMLHFFYGLPRLIFLTAPLAYLLMGAHVFQATALMIAAYAVPHIFHASLTNSRIQGRFRHSFWNEVYESVLAWYILRPALVAFVNPRAGKFNVTDKGGVTEEGYFDWNMARPYIVLLILNLAGFAVGLGRLAFQESPDVATVLINLAWTVYNLIMTSAAVAVAGETRQMRRAPRVTAALPASIMFDNGKTLACETIDFSQTGLGLRVAPGTDIPLGEPMRVSLYRGTEEGIFPVVAAFRRGDHLGLQFKDLNVQQEVQLAQMTFARADTWAQAWGRHERDSMPSAFADILRIAVKGFGELLRSTAGLVTFRRDRRAIPPTPETGDQ